MAILRRIPRKGRAASLRGQYMVDAVRGVLRVRKWPRKRGPPRSEAQKFWVDWFRQANFLAKYADPMSQVRAIEMSQGSGMYPRDILLKAMRGRLYSWFDQDGWRWYSVAAIQDISESLDILGQTVGDVLVRALDRWRPPPAGIVGDVLTNAGPGAPPAWAAPPPPIPAVAGALVTNLANQSIATNSFVAVAFTSEIYDTASMHDNGTNNTRLTIPAGWTFVRLHASSRWAASASGIRALNFKKNGAFFMGNSMHWKLATGDSSDSIVSPVLPCVGGDYFEMIVRQTTGGALNIIGPSDNVCFSAERKA